MIRFLTLGTTELAADAGSSVDGSLIARPKRLALLAYLTVARPGSRHFRDTLLALFWPDMDTERARHALRQTLYHLRRELGAGVVMGGDHAGVGISGAKLWCDAVAFGEEIARDRLAHALALYGGEFMTGFHSECGTTYDLWLDTVRRRLERKAADAAWSLTDRAEVRGDTREACTWARRVLELQPYHERAARRLIRLLATTGQRVEALHMYAAFVGRLKGEGLAPEPETRALFDAVRHNDLEKLAGRYRAADESSTRPAGDAGRCVVAVLPFAPLSVTAAESIFAEGLTEMLITELAQRDCVSVLSRTSVQQYRAGNRSLSAVASELGANFVIEGSVTVDADDLRVTAQLIALGPERHLWARSFDGPFAEPLALQADLAVTIVDGVAAVLHAHAQERPGNAASRDES